MLQIIIAFLATVLTAVQALLLFTEEKAFCFGEGCEIVESLTTVPTLYFNIAGTFYFLVLFWCFYFRRGGSEFWTFCSRLLLLSGLAAEAVLLFFQYSIAETFCYYCLVIFGCILLLNVLEGFMQVLRGVVIVATIMIACFSLDFKGTGGVQGSLGDGSVAILNEDSNTSSTSVYLFISKTCSHCDDVKQFLQSGIDCKVSFNPVEKIDDFTFPGAIARRQYDPQINLSFLRQLSLTGVPVLVAKMKNETSVISGSGAIIDFLSANCSAGGSQLSQEETRSDTTSNNSYAKYLGSSSFGEENCQIEEDCEPEGQQQTTEKTTQMQ